MSGSIHRVVPRAACERGRITIHGSALDLGDATGPDVRLGETRARMVAARPSRITVIVPADIPGGPTPLHVGGVNGEPPVVNVGAVVARGLHQVDNPAVDAQGRVYVTYSGARAEVVPVSIFRIAADGTRESFVAGLVNPTSMAFSPSGRLHVSSRFEGVVYRVDEHGQYEPAVTEVGVACGLAFDADGVLFVGDRSGTIFRVRADGLATMLATLPSSVAAFHLAMGPDRCLYVTGPTLTSRDVVYRVHLDGEVEVAWTGFGRPQGLAFGPDGLLYVVEALAGASGVFRLRPGAEPELVVSGEGLIGLAFDPAGDMLVTSNDTLWRLSGVIA